MAIPVLDVTIHEKYLAGLGKTVRFRAYKNKEQKILLEAKESQDELRQRNAIMQVMQLCVVDDIDVNDLAVFDFVTLFIALRAASVNEIAKVSYRYSWYDEEDNPKESELTLAIDLRKVGLTVSDDSVEDTIQISNNLYIKLKYPSIGVIMSKPSDDDIIKSAIEYIYDEETIYDNFTDEELSEFVDNLDVKTLLKIDKFIDNAPRVEHIEHVVLDDGSEEDIIFTSISDFFH